MYCNEIIANPSNKMILERPLDDLVKDITGEKLVYIRTGKVIGEGLHSCFKCIQWRIWNTYHNILVEPILFSNRCSTNVVVIYIFYQSFM